MENLVDFLDRTSLFRDLLPQHKETVAKYLTEVTIAPGTVFIKEGEEGNCLYILIQGEVLQPLVKLCELFVRRLPTKING